MTDLDSVLTEIDGLSEKTHELVSRTRRLISTLDTQTKIIRESTSKVKEMLGVETKLCSICAKDALTHCVDNCHHVYCRSCCLVALRSQRCHICRAPVVSMFKIFM